MKTKINLEIIKEVNLHLKKDGEKLEIITENYTIKMPISIEASQIIREENENES
ncbi:MAG: hypothetical protein V3U15_05385 [Nitrospinota bacterium]